MYIEDMTGEVSEMKQATVSAGAGRITFRLRARVSFLIISCIVCRENLG